MMQFRINAVLVDNYRTRNVVLVSNEEKHENLSLTCIKARVTCLGLSLRESRETRLSARNFHDLDCVPREV